jgi:phosphoglycerate-specific signal transduction histidine kinase
VDATRIQQVFWNLLTNAIKFTPDGGLIEVVLREEEGEGVVSVRDTGRGIEPDVVPHIFDTFRQSSVADRAEQKVSDSVWQSCATWCNCMAAQSKLRARAKVAGRPSSSGCRC